MSVQQTLGLAKPPVAVAFLDQPPPGVERRAGGEAPAGCAFWREAQEGRVFYTVLADHYNCAVGAHTHAIPLPAARAGELEQTVGFMVQSGYLRMEDVPGIPTLATTPAVVAYGPVEAAPFAPDVVIVAARPAQAMLVYEAAVRAGAGEAVQALGRPACAALPFARKSGTVALSLGCKGNRTFTGLPDEELYVVIPGAKWPAVEEAVGALAAANETMGAHYRQHAAHFAAADSQEGHAR